MHMEDRFCWIAKLCSFFCSFYLRRGEKEKMRIFLGISPL